MPLYLSFLPSLINKANVLCRVERFLACHWPRHGEGACELRGWARELHPLQAPRVFRLCLELVTVNCCKVRRPETKLRLRWITGPHSVCRLEWRPAILTARRRHRGYSVLLLKYCQSLLSHRKGPHNHRIHILPHCSPGHIKDLSPNHCQIQLPRGDPLLHYSRRI